METTSSNAPVPSIARQLPAVLLQGVNVWSVVGNIIIIITIAKTPGLRGFSGALMVNQAVADILLELVTVVLYILSHISRLLTLADIQILLRLSVFALNGVVAHSLSALSINLYFAICRQQAFKQIMTWKRVYLMLTLSWLTNAGLVCLYYTTPGFYTFSVRSGDIVMNLTQDTCWLWVVILFNIIAVPFCSALGCYIRIHNFTKCPTLSTVGHNNMKKLKLSQMIHIVTILFLLTYIPVIVVVSLRVETAGARAAAAIVNYSYHICKLFIYLKFYKPFRQTARSMCCCCGGGCCCRCHNRVGTGHVAVINVHTIETSVNLRPSEKYTMVTNF